VRSVGKPRSRRLGWFYLSNIALLAMALSIGALGLGLLGGTQAVMAQANQEGEDIVPNFSGVWRTEAGFTAPRDASAPGGIVALTGVVDDPFVRLGDASNPILQPHAIAPIEARNAKMIAGADGLPHYSLCWPMGVPGALTMADPVVILQSPDEILILYQRTQHVRHIMLNVPHSEVPKLDWFGESVGHYEGNILVIDTIALDPRGDLDRFDTPHSEQLHVIERYGLSEDKNTIFVDFVVEDPLNFTSPWSASSDYWRIDDHRTFSEAEENPSWAEFICAENNFDVRTGKPYPIPQADKVDF
jgi:hypothetical protein